MSDQKTTGTTDLFEIISTMRSMRRLKTDPIPDALLRKILRSARQADDRGALQTGLGRDRRTEVSSR